MKIIVKDENGIVLKVYEVNNPIQVSVIANKYDYWEYN